MKKDCFKYKQWLEKQTEGEKQSSGDKVNSVQKKNEALFLLSTTDNGSSLSSSSNHNWYIDSGATSHVINNPNLMAKFDTQHKCKVDVANGGTENVHGKGTCKIKLMNESGSTTAAVLSNVLYAPQITENMLSVSKLSCWI